MPPVGGWLDLDRELRTDVQPSVRVRWMCLAAGTVTVAATAFVLFAVRGPDPCLPLACSNFGWSFRVYNLAPALTGLQAGLLFVGSPGRRPCWRWPPRATIAVCWSRCS